MSNFRVNHRLPDILQFCVLLALPQLCLFQNSERSEFLESRYWNIIPVSTSHSNLLGFGTFLNQNISCHRTWNTNASKTLQEVREEASNMTFLSRHDMFRLHMECRRAIPHWPFCIMNRSPFSIRWAFFSIITCKYLETGETFSLTFDQFKFETGSYNRKPSKYLKFINDNSLNQGILDAANRIQRRRDFHTDSRAFIAIAILMKTIAEHLNSTVLSIEGPPHTGKGFSKLDQQAFFRSPTIHPRIFGRTVTRLDRMALIDSTRYTRIESVDFNFVYCDTPQLLRSQVYDLTIIFQAFEPAVWFILVVILVMGSLLLSRTCFLKDIMSAFFTLFSSLLGGNLRFGAQSGNKSVFFTGWMLISIILNNYYTGSMTSVLIAPLGEKIMARLAQLYRQDYKFVFPSTATTIFQLVNVSAFGEENRWDRFRKDHPSSMGRGNGRRRYNQSREIAMLKKMLGTNSKEHSLPVTSFTRAVGVGYKKAAFGPWTYCMRIYNMVIKYLKDKNAKLPPDKQISRHCYLGQRLIASGGLFWGFLPPSNEAPAIVFQQFLEGGIYNYWMKEYDGTSYASRVQDRSQVKSPTKILPPDSESNKIWSRMSLKDGHTMTIVFLWSLGLSLSVLAFILEHCVSKTLAKMQGAKRDKLEDDFILFSRYMK